VSNANYKCSTPQQDYFVKVYRDKSPEEVRRINTLTTRMGRNGIPVPRLAFAGHRFHRIVVHDFVVGGNFQSSTPEIHSVAETFSKIVQVGLDQLRGCE